MLTAERAREDYIKAIYQLGGGEPVAAAELARYLGVSRAAVTKFRRVLEARRLVAPTASRTDPIRLTASGLARAIGMVRRHRLVETFLHRVLGLGIDAVHAQAEAIEHVLSDDVTDRLDHFLGFPRSDPHGHPIVPERRGTTRRARRVLADEVPGARIRIEGIPDRDAALTRRLIAQRVLPGLEAVVERKDERGVTLRSARRVHRVSGDAAGAVQVVGAGSGRRRR